MVYGDNSRLVRWNDIIKLKIMSLRVEMENVGDSFMWRFYVLYLKNWKFFKFYNDDEMWVLVNFNVDEELLVFIRCLMVCELLLGLDDVE